MLATATTKNKPKTATQRESRHNKVRRTTRRSNAPLLRNIRAARSIRSTSQWCWTSASRFFIPHKIKTRLSIQKQSVYFKTSNIRRAFMSNQASPSGLGKGSQWEDINDIMVQTRYSFSTYFPTHLRHFHPSFSLKTFLLFFFSQHFFC